VILVDAHVHLFPDKLFEAVWEWFDQKAWPILSKLHSDQVMDYLKQQGVSHAVGLCYAHKPGLAESLNAYMAGMAALHPGLIPFGTVFPGEPGQEDILKRAFEVHGLRGVKIHCHVQQVSPDAEEMKAVCEAVAAHDGVLLIHAGRAPVLPPMREAISSICGVERTGRMLARFPGMKVIVPHLGMDEYEAYRDLLSSFPNLFLDTTMAVGGYFGGEPPLQDLEEISDRVLYGTDFPDLPYPYERERSALENSGLSKHALERIFSGNAMRLFGLRG
jgi:uncharacterized protein